MGNTKYINEYVFLCDPPVAISEFKGNPLPDEEREQRNTIWTVLVFRMICWFLLHDFDPEDVKTIPIKIKRESDTCVHRLRLL
jgi:hypothetical protein